LGVTQYNNPFYSHCNELGVERIILGWTSDDFRKNRHKAKFATYSENAYDFNQYAKMKNLHN